jgi:hypothetical protein
MFRTEHEFTLPLGYQDQHGTLHREGVMRLATAADEILPLQDPRVVNNPAYLLIILLSRVVTKLGTVAQITPKTIEGLFAADLDFLQELYNDVNSGGRAGQLKVECPQCRHNHVVDVVRDHDPGESSATPWTDSARR